VSILAFELIPIFIDAIAVLGLYVISCSGRLSVGHAAFFGLGGYASGLLSTYLNAPAAVSVCIGALLAGLAGAVFGAIVDRLSHWFFATTTIAFSVMVTGLISSSEFFGGAVGLHGVPLVVDFRITSGCLLATVAFVVALDHSSLGRRIKAVRESELAAESIGINLFRTRVLAMFIGTTLAGLAGGLWVHYLGLIKPSDMGLERSLLFLIYLAIGGTETWYGALLGTLVLGYLPEVLRFSHDYRLAFFGALLTVVMVLRPYGLLPAGMKFGFLSGRRRTTQPPG
jgi:branched-chain amino acid transport system permease protein